jgi:hypothetical protein
VTRATPRQAALVVGTVLLLVYLATLAPGITLWDAGEFASAVESLGVPHPPGTPLYILVARAWRSLLPFVATAVATNLLAAACTATSAGLAAGLLARWTRDPVAGIAGGLAFGAMSTVWSNATETEVYSASLLLSMVMLWAGDEAGRRRRSRDDVAGVADAGGSARYLRLLGFLFAVAPPLHLSALVAAPGAIALATVDAELRVDGPMALLLIGTAMLAMGVGTGSFAVAGAGALVMAGAVGSNGRRRTGVRREALVLAGLVALASSVILFLVIRARFDPAINQGNPATVSAAIDVISRRQYDVPGLWPRRAPFWLQIGNFFQYVDWQFALGLDRAVGPALLRTPFTPLFLALAVMGSVAHRRRDRRSWAAMTMLVAGATFGVIVYLNLRAGPSYGYGVLPADADREARERDYFFALGFAGLGMWIGQGAVRAARSVRAWRHHRHVGWAGVAVAALPLVLNWRAADRQREPGASLPNAFARVTLETAPANAVLFVAGDNDTYPLWYAQVANEVRRDVTLVTVPLLGATWYRVELARRSGLYDSTRASGWRGAGVELADIAGRASRAGRPVLAAVALEPVDRAALGDAWSFRGLSYARARAGSAAGPLIDVPAVDSTIARIELLLAGPADPSLVAEPAARYLISLLACPALAKQAAEGSAGDTTRLLDSRCNFR